MDWEQLQREALEIRTLYNSPEEPADGSRITSRHQIKANMKNRTFICSNCHEAKDKRSIKFCGRCHSAHYCSRECQKANWRMHKAECRTVEERPLEIKLAERAAANFTLIQILDHYTILLLDLLTKPENAFRYCVNITCGLSPAAEARTAEQRNAAASGESSEDKSPQVVFAALKIEREPMAMQQPQLWRMLAEKMAENVGTLVVMYRFFCEASSSTVIVASPIDRKELDFMATNPKVIRSNLPPIQADLTTLLGCYNSMIQMDMFNKFGLRAPKPSPHA